MTPEQMRELANLVAKEIDLASWAWALLVSILSVIGVFCGAYLKKRAENLATKDDFKDIKRQLEETTKAAEEIKRSINDRGWLAQQRWGRREAHYLEILNAIFRYEKACKRIVEIHMDGKHPDSSLIISAGSPLLIELRAAEDDGYKAYLLAQMFVEDDVVLEILKATFDNRVGIAGGDLETSVGSIKNVADNAAKHRTKIIEAAKATLKVLEK